MVTFTIIELFIYYFTIDFEAKTLSFLIKLALSNSNFIASIVF